MHMVRLVLRMRPLSAALIVCAVAWHSTRAVAQSLDGSEEAILEKAALAFFHVETRGTPRDANAPTQEALRTGKAFAVGQNTLVTARNVVGSETEWKLKRTTRDEITRTVRPLDRTVTLGAVSGPEIAPDSLFVLPAPSSAIDAASIFVPGLQLGAHFQLSLCDLVEGKIYNALMTGASDPSSNSSLGDLKVVPLVARGYEPAAYGQLYVFEPVEQPAYASEPWGHGGSPILDEDGNVAAVIAAVTVEAGSASKVLATPIQPLFPGTNQILARGPDPSTHGGRLKCSMVDMVGRIHDQVASHAIWTISPDTEDGEPTGDILFSYDSVADPPNIASIRVEYGFLGIEKAGRSFGRLFSGREPGQDFVVLEPERRRPRTFSTSEIVSIGRNLVERRIEPNGGSIWSIEVYITPTLKTGDVLTDREKRYEVQWSAFQ